MVPDYLIDLFTKISTLHNHETRQTEFNLALPRPNTNFCKKSISYSTAPLYCTRMIFYKSWYLA